MSLSWNEIKDRALKFSREWAEEGSEDAEAKSFRDGFFERQKPRNDHNGCLPC